LCFRSGEACLVESGKLKMEMRANQFENKVVNLIMSCIFRSGEEVKEYKSKEGEITL
jgi:hypothetical protein